MYDEIGFYCIECFGKPTKKRQTEKKDKFSDIDQNK